MLGTVSQTAQNKFCLIQVLTFSPIDTLSFIILVAMLHTPNDSFII